VTVWGYILERKSKKPGFSFAVVDEPFILNSTTTIRSGDTVLVDHNDVIGLIERVDYDNRPVIKIAMQDGVVIRMRRVDGKTSPIVVIIDEPECGQTYMVDHQGHTQI